MNNLKFITILSIITAVAILGTSTLSNAMAQDNMSLTMDSGMDNMTNSTTAGDNATMMYDDNFTSMADNSTS
ncbi:MAG: hypothetical protein R2685_02835 [Candidatus Nitrosocosmicus sp.]|jgi:hypothetical protein|nr:hypothetical protein [Candidatus Nitrosocosmicus sp.]